VKCAAKHIESELYVAKEKIQNHFDSIEHRSTEQVLADPLTRGLPPSVLREHTVDMGFMVKPMISGLLRAQVKILSKWISVLWLINLIVITIMMTHARYIYL
jgi:hypothetical protein